VSDSLIIGNIIELLGGGVPSTHPLCAGAVFHLSPGWDFSSPQYAASQVAALLLGGGLPLGEHVDNRHPKFPVTIVVPASGNGIDADRATLAGAREVLTQAVSTSRWQMVWTREGGLPMLFDCFHADPVVVTWSLPVENTALACQMEISFSALPYGRSDSVELLPFNSPSTGWTVPPASVVIDDFNTIDNFLNGDNTNFDAGTLGNWVAFLNDSIAVSATQARSSPNSLRMSSTAAGTMQAASCATGSVTTLGMPCVVNDTVAVSAWLRAGTTGRTCSVGGIFYDSFGNSLGAATFGTGVADTNAAFTNITASLTAPASAAWFQVVIQVAATAAGAELHYVDDISVNRGAIFSTTDIALFTQSTRVAVGGHSLHWARTDNDAPNYTHQLPSPVNILGLKRMSVWVGLGTLTYSQWHTGRVTLSVMLTDTSGNTVTMVTTASVKASSLATAPHWQKMSGLIPQVTTFDYTNVTQYRLQIWNKIAAGNILSTQQPVLQAEAYFDTLRADATTTGSPGTRGALYLLPGVIGTAPAPLTLQLQPGPSVVQSTATFTTVGSNNFTTGVGVTNIQKSTAVAGGGGGSAAGAAGGGGGGGGECSIELNIAVTASTLYHPIVGGAGTAGNTGGTAHGGNGGDSSFIGNASFGAYAHGGQGGGQGGSTTYGGSGGSGSSNSQHFSGGAGGAVVPVKNLDGGGGGGSGGTSSAGRAGSYGAAASAVDGGGPGGSPGLTGGASGHVGSAPASGYGGGGGGGAVDGSGINHNGGAGYSGWVQNIWAAVAASALKTVILHSPPRDAPNSIAPFIVAGNGADTPNGGTTYTAPVTGSLQARYSGTYQVILTNFSWNTPASSRTVTVTVIQHKADGTTPSVALARTFIPNTDADHVNLLNGIVMLGTVTLPIAPIAPGNNTDTIQCTVNDTNTSDRFLDLLLLDTTGQTLIYSSSASGVNNFWTVEPDIGIDFGQVYGSQVDWDQSSSVLNDCPVLAGGPIAVLPGENPLMVYSVQGAPAVQASYQPRWMLDRLQ
jgi:hypothetical protein